MGFIYPKVFRRAFGSWKGARIFFCFQGRPKPGGAPAPPGKRLRRYAYGPDRTNRCPKLTSKGHTDLRSCISEAKFVKESDFDVKSRLAPPKSTEIDEKHFSDTENFSNFNFAKFFERTNKRRTNKNRMRHLLYR